MAAWEFSTLQNIADKHGWHKFISMQNYYNLLYRGEEREMLPYCRDTGVGCIPWGLPHPAFRPAICSPGRSHKTRSGSPVARGAPREESNRVLKTMIRSRETQVDKAIVERVEEIAKRREVAMATVATA